MELAMQSSWFKNSRFKRGRGKGCRAAGDRLGLGASSADSGGGGGDGGQQYAFGDPDAGRCVLQLAISVQPKRTMVEATWIWKTNSERDSIEFGV